MSVFSGRGRNLATLQLLYNFRALIDSFLLAWLIVGKWRKVVIAFFWGVVWLKDYFFKVLFGCTTSVRELICTNQKAQIIVKRQLIFFHM